MSHSTEAAPAAAGDRQHRAGQLNRTVAYVVGAVFLLAGIAGFLVT